MNNATPLSVLPQQLLIARAFDNFSGTPEAMGGPNRGEII
jgi:hypothetical protein